jgi:Lrp/AsnC family transcriptional regulator, leucine-responsive regulatory protein
MAAAAAIDGIDRKILDILQRDARVTNQRLSELVSLSPSACYERVRRLEKAGILAGYRATLGLEKLCRSVTVVATAQLASHDQAAFQRFEAAVKATPEIVEAVLVSGPFDYVLRFVAPDMSAYHTAADTLLSKGPPLAQFHSHVVLERTKPFAGFPLDRLL